MNVTELAATGELQSVPSPYCVWPLLHETNVVQAAQCRRMAPPPPLAHCCPSLLLPSCLQRTIADHPRVPHCRHSEAGAIGGGHEERHRPSDTAAHEGGWGCTSDIYPWICTSLRLFIPGPSLLYIPALVHPRACCTSLSLYFPAEHAGPRFISIQTPTLNLYAPPLPRPPFPHNNPDIHLQRLAFK